MGVRRIFSGVGQNGRNLFFPLETKKTTFFAEIFKTRGPKHSCPASDAHDCNVSNLKKISKMSTLPPWKNFYERPWLL